MVSPQFHKFFGVFDEKLQQLLTGGIINFRLNETWLKQDDKKKYAHLYAHLEGPQVLTLENLEAGFCVWLVSLSFAVIVFLIEWIVKLCQMFFAKFETMANNV